MKAFNLQAALGAKIFTRDGRGARIICSDLNANVPLVVAVESRNGLLEEIFHYPESGRYLSDENDHGLDLMHETVERSGWITILPGVGSVYNDDIYPSREECLNAVDPSMLVSVQAIEIHWEV